MPDNHLRTLIDVAAGREPADLVLANAKVVNVVSHEIQEGDLAVVGGRVAGLGSYAGRETVDLRGRYVCPGLIDAHVHIESSLLSVPEFARVVVARGTTAVIADPHEFANVMGTEGISFVLRTAKYAPIDIYVMLSSCVPASPFESAGTALGAEDIAPFLSNPWVLGLAEVMNYPGVVNGQEDVLQKITMAGDTVVDGHAPGLEGFDLNAYAAAGIMSDHECITAEEATEKLRRGLHIMIREGSQAKNLDALIPLVTHANADRFMFCTDDKKVHGLLDEGHIDCMVRRSISKGMDPILAIRLGSYNTARYFGLSKTGALLPGYRADIAVMENLEECRITQVFRRGELVAENSVCTTPRVDHDALAQMRSSIDTHWLEPDDFLVQAPSAASESEPPNIHVIEVLENRIDTERTVMPATLRDGHIVADPARDLAKIAVIERHRATGQVGRAFVHGFNLEGGAIASTVAHDAHNLIVVGTHDADMLAAAIHLVKRRGGFVAVRDGRILGEVPLPIAGLVSDAPAEEVVKQLQQVTEAAQSLGCRLLNPFLALAFLSLSVIGKLKITNTGLIDVERFEAIPLVAES